jgi:hypothetical protein
MDPPNRSVGAPLRLDGGRLALRLQVESRLAPMGKWEKTAHFTVNFGKNALKPAHFRSISACFRSLQPSGCIAR